MSIYGYFRQNPGTQTVPQVIAGWMLIPPVIWHIFIGFDHPHKPRSWEELDCGWHPQRALRKRPPAPARQSDLWPPVWSLRSSNMAGKSLVGQLFFQDVTWCFLHNFRVSNFRHLKSGFLFLWKNHRFPAPAMFDDQRPDKNSGVVGKEEDGFSMEKTSVDFHAPNGLCPSQPSVSFQVNPGTLVDCASQQTRTKHQKMAGNLAVTYDVSPENIARVLPNDHVERCWPTCWDMYLCNSVNIYILGISSNSNSLTLSREINLINIYIHTCRITIIASHGFMANSKLWSIVVPRWSVECYLGSSHGS